MVLAAGALRHAVTLQRKTEIANAMGEPEASWVNVQTMFASVRALGVVERTEAAKLVGEATHLVTVRGLQVEPTPADRFEFRDELRGTVQTFEVIGSQNWDFRSHEVRVLCRERL